MTLIESSDKELQVSHWFYSHISVIKKVLYGFAITIDAIILIIAIILLIQYLVVTPKYNTMLQNLADQKLDFDSYKNQFPLQELSVVETSALLKDSNTYTAIAKIKNPNKDWIATEITYTFKMPGLETEERTGFAYPTETKILSLSGISYASSSASIPSTTISIKDVKWKRRTYDIDAIVIPDFSIEDITKSFVDTSQDVDVEKLITRITAQTQNNTIYSFWNVKAHILLYDTGGSIIDYKTLNLSEYLSLEEREVKVIWTETLFGVKSTEVYLEADTIDRNNIMTNWDAINQPL